jgi:hypothetical protein
VFALSVPRISFGLSWICRFPTDVQSVTKAQMVTDEGVRYQRRGSSTAWGGIVDFVLAPCPPPLAGSAT